MKSLDFLKKSGLDVATAVDGRDGLEQAQDADAEDQAGGQRRQHAQHGRSDHGREDPRRAGNKTVNIVMLTTENSPVMKERGKAAGIKGWIVKPFKGDAVIATFKKLCE
jgi:two-component system chemotaxis response regulator CheY